MSIEKRKETFSRYYYTGKRVDGRVVKTYFGRASGSGAMLDFRVRRLCIATRDSNRDRFRREQHDQREINASAGQMIDRLKQLRALELIWPRLGDEVESIRSNLITVPRRPISEVEPMSGYPTYTELRALLKRVDEGDLAARLELNTWIETAPDAVAEIVNLIRVVQERAIDVLAAGSISTRILLEASQAMEVDAVLKSVGSDPLGRMVAEIMLVSRLDLLRCNLALNRSFDTKSEYEFWSSMAAKATKRYERAGKAWEKYCSALHARSRSAHLSPTKGS